MKESVICPKCNSKNTCKIVYGYPLYEEEFLKLVAEKKIHPGGCIVSEDNPMWYCNNCENKWDHYKNPKDNDSFDYDKGFNLDEVSDQ